MPEDGRRRRLDVIGCHEFTAIQPRQGFARQEQVHGGPRAGTHLKLGRRPSRPDHLAQVAQDLRTGLNAHQVPPGGQHFLGVGYRLQLLLGRAVQVMSAVISLENRQLFFRAGITEQDLAHESIDLRFGQRDTSLRIRSGSASPAR